MSKLDLRPNAINLTEAALFEPAPFDFVLPGFVRGTVGMLTSPGGLGKSYFALEASCAIAAPTANLLGLPLEHAGNVLYVSAEDDKQALHHRVHHIAQNLPEAAWRSVAERLTLVPTVGLRLNVLDEDVQDAIVNAGQNARLIVLDTLRRLHDGDENDNGAMTKVLAALEYIAVESGAAVLFLHHTSKASTLQSRGHEQQAARGASVLSDNVRWASYLVGMSDTEAEKLVDNGRPIVNPRAYVRFGVSKVNYTAAAVPAWFRRELGGVLVPAQVTTAGTSARKGLRVVRDQTVLETL